MKLIDQIVDLCQRDSATLPVQSMSLARLSFFDWIVCGLGGCTEPVAEKLRQYVETEYATGRCSVFGGCNSTPVAAALVNGAVSHSLDYDDTHFAHIGHLSVGIFPASYAAAQETDASIEELLEAFVLGAEAAIKIGVVLGSDHYERGYHQTATSGAFGATVAAARLYHLSEAQCRTALGLCSSRASGLKNQFGTMGKPLNAGYSASNGVECARLAALGVSSAIDGLQGQQGFIETHSMNPQRISTENNFLFDDVRFKLHACCHGTHAMIEAILQAQKEKRLTLQQVEKLQVRVHPKWLRVCDNKNPNTGLEIKFSYVWLAGMTVMGFSTADPKTYTDKLCSSSELKSFAEKVSVVAGEISDTSAEITLTLLDGSEVAERHELLDKIDTELLCQKLRGKARSVIGEKSDGFWIAIHEKSNQSARDLVFS